MAVEPVCPAGGGYCAKRKVERGKKKRSIGKNISFLKVFNSKSFNEGSLFDQLPCFYTIVSSDLQEIDAGRIS